MLIALLIGLANLKWGHFIDEEDNFVVGWLLSEGHVLYRDVFSHHFPLAYYWAALIILLFGQSVLAIRLSILLYQLIVFAVAMRMSGAYLPLALSSVVWMIVRPFYRGNMLLYSHLAAGALLIVYALLLALLSERVQARSEHALVLGFCIPLALLADPLAVYPLAVALFFLLLRPALRRVALPAIAIAAGLLLLWLAALIASDSFAAFHADAVVFNRDVYSRYLESGAWRGGELLLAVVSGLQLLTPPGLQLNPLAPLSAALFDRWLFAGGLWRLALLLLSLLWLRSGRRQTALFSYLFAAALLAGNDSGFRSAPFVLIALLAVFLIVTWPQRRPLLRPLQLLTALLVIWLSARSLVYTIPRLPDRAYDAFYAATAAHAHLIRDEVACGRADIALGFYPAQLSLYWFSEMQPLGGYSFLLPWVADVAYDDLTTALLAGPSVVFIEQSTIWGLYESETYLQPLLAFLEQQYVRLDSGWYVAPELAAQCHS